MDSAAGAQLADYLTVARRRWRIIAAAVLAGILVAVGALTLLPKTYTATTVVQVDPSGLEGLTGERWGRTNSEVNLDTEAQVLLSAVVAREALEISQSGVTAREAQDRVSVTVPPNSSVLKISYAGDTPESARDGSAAFAEAYLAYRVKRIEDQIDDRLEGIGRELDTRYGELEDHVVRAGDAMGPARVQADTRVEVLREEIADLNAERVPLLAVRDSVSSGVVLTPPEKATSPSSPVPALWLTAGPLLGLLAGVAATYLAERARRHGAAPTRFEEDDAASSGESGPGRVARHRAARHRTGAHPPANTPKEAATDGAASDPASDLAPQR